MHLLPLALPPLEYVIVIGLFPGKADGQGGGVARVRKLDDACGGVLSKLASCFLLQPTVCRSSMPLPSIRCSRFLMHHRSKHTGQIHALLRADRSVVLQFLGNDASFSSVQEKCTESDGREVQATE